MFIGHEVLAHSPGYVIILSHQHPISFKYSSVLQSLRFQVVLSAGKDLIILGRRRSTLAFVIASARVVGENFVESELNNFCASFWPKKEL